MRYWCKILFTSRIDSCPDGEIILFSEMQICYCYSLLVRQFTISSRTYFYQFYSDQGWRQEFSDGGMTLPIKGAKILFLGYFHCQKSPKNSFSPSDRGASMFRRGAISPSSPPLIWIGKRILEDIYFA